MEVAFKIKIIFKVFYLLLFDFKHFVFFLLEKFSICL